MLTEILKSIGLVKGKSVRLLIVLLPGVYDLPRGIVYHGANRIGNITDNLWSEIDDCFRKIREE